MIWRNVTIDFADGQERAQASGKGAAYIDRAEATLPSDVRNRITRKRKAGDADAAVDPLSEPDVKAAVARATFEVLVGFDVTPQMAAFNRDGKRFRLNAGSAVAGNTNENK